MTGAAVGMTGHGIRHNRCMAGRTILTINSDHMVRGMKLIILSAMTSTTTHVGPSPRSSSTVGNRGQTPFVVPARNAAVAGRAIIVEIGHHIAAFMAGPAEGCDRETDAMR